METETLKLKKPVKLGSEEITELVFREPVAKDLRSLPLNPMMGDMLDLVARLSGVLPAAIDNLSIEDATAAIGVVGNFMAASPATGESA